MADALVAVLVKEVVQTLGSVATQELALLRGLKNDILSLKNDFEQIQAVLQDAEEKRVKNNAVEVWIKRLRSASLEVENVLDDISTEALLQRLHKKRVKYRVRAFFSSSHNKYMTRVRIAHKVKDIKSKLDVINSERFKLDLTPSGTISHVDDMGGVGEKMPDRETSSLIHDSSNIFGRNKEKEMVVEKICNKDIGKYENGEICVYSVWGMGGLGKTTLAQLVYDHERVSKNFELKCWVYVSENFQVKEIIKGIITSIDKCECTLTRLDVLQESLQNKLRGKKFLIVLDDVWIEDDEKTKWDQLSETLSCGVEGSVILTTTRSQTTSRMMAKVPELQHKLGHLSEEDSWLLFKKFAFAEGREGDDVSELEPTGREIAQKCEGLPLALKTLGSLMWSKSSTSDWQHVKDNIWELPDNNIFPALKLSYDNLLPHLKRCFAYCCLFPKGYKLKKNELIPLWVSNGFIPSRGALDLYVLGEEIFNGLVWRSFFQVDKSNKYKMHDLMHDMARHVMGDDCLVIEPGKKVITPNEVLHVRSSCPDEKFQFSSEDLEKLTSSRSLIMFGNGNKCNIHQICNHVHLRVLYLFNMELWTFPESICKLKHLKYLNLSHSGLTVIPSIEVLPKSVMYLQNLQFLNLSYSRIKVLPGSIIHLHNLQVLILRYCTELCKLPKGLRYMSSLQHLDITGTHSLLHLPSGVKELTSLKTLTLFRVGNKSGAKIGELGNLDLLEGELQIDKLENVGSLSEAMSANLKSKSNLSVLRFSWGDLDKSERKHDDEEVLEGLEPNPRLEELWVKLYTGKNISPSWMVNLKNLVALHISMCENCEFIPALGRLPNLRDISLVSMDSLKRFHDDDTNMLGYTANMFLSLRYLDILVCPSLVSLPSNLPSLENLRLSSCNELVSIPDEIQTLKNLKELKIKGCKHLFERYEMEKGVDWPKISHIPNIYIEPSFNDDGCQ